METEEITVLPAKVKNTMQDLLVATNSQSTTKVIIKNLAEEVAKSVKSPLNAHVALKPMIDLLTDIKKNLLEEALIAGKAIAESKRMVGNLPFAIRSRMNIDYEKDPNIAEAIRKVKELKEIKKLECQLALKNGEEHHLLLEPTEYIQVNIPKGE